MVKADDDLKREIDRRTLRPITTIDDAGKLQDLVASGFAPDEYRQTMEWTDGPGVFEHLRDIEAPCGSNIEGAAALSVSLFGPPSFAGGGPEGAEMQ